MNSRVLEAVSKINAVLLWRAVQRKLPAIVGIMVTAGMVAYFAMAFITPEFSAVSRISLDGPSSDKPLSQGIISRQIQHFYNSDFQQNVIKTLNLQTHPEFISEALDGKALEKRVISQLSITYDKLAGNLSVKFVSTDPNLASDASNAFSNAYLVQAGEKPKQFKARLVSRAVVPLSPDFPKKGPFALFIMSLMGLALLGYVLIREALQSSGVDEENSLDHKHHNLDLSLNHQPVKQAPIIKKRKAGPVFRGIYPWQPEESLDELFEQLTTLKKTGKTFKVLFSAENEGVAIHEEALSVARAFADQKHPTLLIDATSDSSGLTSHLGLEQLAGFSDVIRDPSELGKIIHTDNETTLHVVARGSDSFADYTEQEKTNLGKIFHAWSSVYEVVIVCCSNQQSLNLYTILGASFEAGVFVQNDNSTRENTVSKSIAAKNNKTDIIYFRQTEQQPAEDNVITINTGSVS